MATHSSTLAWKTSWMEEPGRLQPMGSQGVGHDWVASLHYTRRCEEFKTCLTTIWYPIHQKDVTWFSSPWITGQDSDSLLTNRMQQKWCCLITAVYCVCVWVCVCVCERVCVYTTYESESVSHSSHPTLCDPRLFCPWNFPGKNTEVGCRALLQGIFPTQGSSPHLLCLLHWQAGFFTNSTTWEALHIPHSVARKKRGHCSGPSHTAPMKELCSTLFAVFFKASRALTLSL